MAKFPTNLSDYPAVPTAALTFRTPTWPPIGRCARADPPRHCVVGQSRSRRRAANVLGGWPLPNSRCPLACSHRGTCLEPVHPRPAAAAERFPLSGAKYITNVGEVEACGISFACVPYTRGPLRGGLPRGEVLVSHSPPKPVLDRANSGEDAGDDSLRSAVRRSREKPRLWLFGHIHEGAGAARVRFGVRSDGATTLVNAANANPGPAKRLIKGPVVIDFERPPR